jgi:hypothetical protein
MEKHYIDIDVQRTCLQQRFFEHLRFDTSAELLAALAGIEVDLDTLAQSHDLRYYLYSGWGYWLLYAKGYLQYLESGTIGRGNIYYDYLTNYYVQREHDPGLCKELRIPFRTIERVAQRYRDLDFFRTQGARGDGEIYKLEPIRLIVGEPPPQAEALLVYTIGDETPLVPRLIDGWHRLFAAKLYGRTSLRAELVSQERQLRHIRGAIEQFNFDGHKLKIHGWCLDPQRVIESIEVRVEGKTVAQVGISFRPDVRQAFDMISHSIRSGFCVDQAIELPFDRPICFQILPLSDWLPVGIMTAYALPGMQDEHVSSPALAEQQLEHQCQQPAFRSVKCLQETLSALTPYRGPESFRSVLDWGAPSGIVSAYLPRFLSAAQIAKVDDVRSTDAMPATGLTAGSFDLVLGFAALTQLTPDAQNVWLEEMHRLLQPGGYLVVGVYGTLLLPFLTAPTMLSELDTHGIVHAAAAQPIIGEHQEPSKRATYQTKQYALQTYARWFDVVNYVDGGLDDLMDLIILRKA